MISSRAVAARLPLGQVGERGGAQQVLGHDLGEGAGRQRRVEPAKGQQLAPEEGALEVLAQFRLILGEERLILGRQRPRWRQDRGLAGRLLAGVGGGRHAAPGDARQVGHLLQDRAPAGGRQPSERLQAGGPEEGGAAAAAREGHADEDLVVWSRRDAGAVGARRRDADGDGRGAARQDDCAQQHDAGPRPGGPSYHRSTSQHVLLLVHRVHRSLRAPRCCVPRPRVTPGRCTLSSRHS